LPLCEDEITSLYKGFLNMASAHFDFSNTWTVITGGASGIGLTCALEVAKAGGNVVVSASRKPEKTQAALQQIQQANPKVQAKAFPCEVGQETSVAAFFEAIGNAGIKIDHVIHSAGISPNTEFFDQTQAEWDQVQNTNATGSFLVTKYAALQMKNNPLQGDFRGRIVLVTSTNGINNCPKTKFVSMALHPAGSTPT